MGFCEPNAIIYEWSGKNTRKISDLHLETVVLTDSMRACVHFCLHLFHQFQWFIPHITWFPINFTLSFHDFIFSPCFGRPFFCPFWIHWTWNSFKAHKLLLCSRVTSATITSRHKRKKNFVLVERFLNDLHCSSKIWLNQVYVRLHAAALLAAPAPLAPANGCVSLFAHIVFRSFFHNLQFLPPDIYVIYTLRVGKHTTILLTIFHYLWGMRQANAIMRRMTRPQK